MLRARSAHAPSRDSLPQPALDHEHHLPVRQVTALRKAAQAVPDTFWGGFIDQGGGRERTAGRVWRQKEPGGVCLAVEEGVGVPQG